MLQAPAPVTSFFALPDLQPRVSHAIARTYLGRSPDSHNPTSLTMPWQVLFLGSATNTGHTFRDRTLSITSLHRQGLGFPKRPTAEASTWTALRHSTLVLWRSKSLPSASIPVCCRVFSRYATLGSYHAMISSRSERHTRVCEGECGAVPVL